MPITPTYPGVYIEEIPSGVRTITGIATSIAAFIDYFPMGLLDKAIQIFNIGDFEREFGGLDARSEASYAIQQFFLNGGTEAWVIRALSGNPLSAEVTILAEDGSPALTIAAGRSELENPGRWGDSLRVTIDPASAENRFNMTVALIEPRNGQQVVSRSEVYQSLSTRSSDSNFVRSVINDEFSGSKLVRITEIPGSNNDIDLLPLQNGTLSGELSPFPSLSNSTPQITVAISGEGEGIARLSAVPTSLQEARRHLEAAIRAARPDLRAFAQATVSVVNNRLRILAGPTAADARVTFATPGNYSTVTDLGLPSGSTVLNGVLSTNIATSFPIDVDEGEGELVITTGEISETLTLPAMSNLEAARSALESAIQGANPAFENVRVVSYTNEDESEQQLIVLAGLPDTSISFSAPEVEEGEAEDPTVSNLGLGGTSEEITALISADLSPVPQVSSNSAVRVTLGTTGPLTATIANDADTLDEIATELQAAIRAAAPDNTSFAEARVAAHSLAGGNRLIVLSGNPTEDIVFAAAPVDDTTVEELQLDNAIANVQSYALEGGADGDPPDANALIGDPGDAKTGMHALENVDLFNILCIPRTAFMPGDDSRTVITHAINFCQDQRAFLIIDTPPGIDEVQEVKDWFDSSGIPRSKNAAFYFPRVQIPDPLNGFKLKSVGASGTIAGLYARTDSDRGVWKAPAGTEALLWNVFKLDASLTDPQNGTLNKVAINCLRTFPIYGTICWGARTLEGADEIGSEWKYVPVRRTALFIEETLYRALKWVVFEPNDEPLWAQIRLNVGAFMNNLFRQGAFQGRTPREAYLVKCDKETTTQNDIDRGIVNILVGFAPLKPAEFVFIKLQQLAGEILT